MIFFNTYVNDYTGVVHSRKSRMLGTEVSSELRISFFFFFTPQNGTSSCDFHEICRILNYRTLSQKPKPKHSLNLHSPLHCLSMHNNLFLFLWSIYCTYITVVDSIIYMLNYFVISNYLTFSASTVTRFRTNNRCVLWWL